MTFSALLVLSTLAALPLRAQTARVVPAAVVPSAPIVVPAGTGAPLLNNALPGQALPAPSPLGTLGAPSPALAPSAPAAALASPAAAASPAARGVASAEAPAARTPDAPAARADSRPAPEPSGERQAATSSPSSEALFDGAAAKAQEPKEWTFMVFLNGHNNLDSFGTLNMKQMEQVGSNDKVNIVVQWASLGKPTKRMLIQRSADGGTVTSPVLESLPAVDMGDAGQLYEFIRWTVERFPAQKYMIDVWDHGSGWHTRNRKGMVTPLDISWDDQTGHHITTEQLGQVLRKTKALIGRPVDVLGFDACLMAMAEVVAEVADSVRYFAGSEELEPGAGWPYHKVLEQWLRTPNDDGSALVKALTEQFVKAYPRQVTFSGLDLAKFPAFMEAARALGAELARLDGTALAAARKAARETRRYGFNDYGDFLHFVSLVAKAPASALTAPVIDAFQTALRDLVVANGSSADRANSNGLSVWLPTSEGLWRTYGERYLAMTWHRLTGWGVAVKRLLGV